MRSKAHVANNAYCQQALEAQNMGQLLVCYTSVPDLCEEDTNFEILCNSFAQ